MALIPKRTKYRKNHRGASDKINNATGQTTRCGKGDDAEKEPYLP